MPNALPVTLGTLAHSHTRTLARQPLHAHTGGRVPASGDWPRAWL